MLGIKIHHFSRGFQWNCLILDIFLKHYSENLRKKGRPTKILSQISVTSEWLRNYFLWRFCYKKAFSIIIRGDIWLNKVIFLKQVFGSSVLYDRGKKKTKVETFDNSKKLLPAIPLDFTNEPLDPDVLEPTEPPVCS